MIGARQKADQEEQRIATLNQQYAAAAYTAPQQQQYDSRAYLSGVPWGTFPTSSQTQANQTTQSQSQQETTSAGENTSGSTTTTAENP
jgi:hypothetical protein